MFQPWRCFCVLVARIRTRAALLQIICESTLQSTVGLAAVADPPHWAHWPPHGRKRGGGGEDAAILSILFVLLLSKCLAPQAGCLEMALLQPLLLLHSPPAFPASLGSQELCERLFEPNASTLHALSPLPSSSCVCMRGRELGDFFGCLLYPWWGLPVAVF